MIKKLIIQNIDKFAKPQSFTVTENQHLIIILLATKAANYSLKIMLAGGGAEADILGIVLGRDKNEVRINTLQDHQAPNTRSNLLIKSALSDRSKFFYEGFIKVEREAQRTDAYQRNENLMLSSEAKAESKPALEILANDVRCTHSATIGKVDQEQLFFLESRGLNEKNATIMIIQGFFKVIMDKIDDKDIVISLERKIQSLLFKNSDN